MSLINKINNLTSKILDLKANFKIIASNNNVIIPDNTLFKDYPKYFTNVSNMPLGLIKNKITATVEEMITKTAEVIKNKITATVEEMITKTAEVIKNKITATVEEKITEAEKFQTTADGLTLYSCRPFLYPTDNCTIILPLVTGSDVREIQSLIGDYLIGIYADRWHGLRHDENGGGQVLVNTAYTIKLLCFSDGTTQLYYKLYDDSEDSYILASSFKRTNTYTLIFGSEAFSGLILTSEIEVKFE